MPAAQGLRRWSAIGEGPIRKEVLRNDTMQIGNRSKLALFMALLAIGCARHREFVACSTTLDECADCTSMVDNADVIEQQSFEQELGSPTTAPAPHPFVLDAETADVPYWNMSLDEAIEYALMNSSVMRKIGANLLQAPEMVNTVYDPSIVATNARFGEEAALSAFDAQFASRLFYEQNDRALNNSLLGGGTNFFLQDLWRFQTEISKQTVAGTEFAIRHNVEDDLNNAPRNIFGTAGDINAHAWTWDLEAEMRHPLLQGSGVDFNRIAGPNATPGEINGVLIARVNTSISAADFQLALRNYLSDVENAYWELVFAYRDLEAKKEARDRALATWQLLKARFENDVAGAEADKVAQAEEQYFRFQQDVENAIGGRLADGTRVFNGSTGGTFQGIGGVYVAERRLRLLMGAPITDGRLIRPVTEPQVAEVVFAWDDLVNCALGKRTELLQQRLRIKRRSLELQASRNFLMPELDFVGRYRRRGFGDNLFDSNAPISTGGPSTNTGTDEWQMGVELAMPIGYRQANAGVRNAELALARERAVLGELERQIVHDVGNAVADVTRLYKVVQTAYNRRAAAQKQFEYLNDEAVLESSVGRRIDFNLLLDAERRLADAQIAYHRARVEYAVALKNVNLEIENLLPYCNVQIAGAAAP